MFRRFRSAKTGRYTSQTDARANPDTTVAEATHKTPLAIARAATRLDFALSETFTVDDVDDLGTHVIAAWAALRAELK